jgi:hypothetical protein
MVCSSWWTATTGSTLCPWPPSLVDLQEMITVSWDNNDMHGCPFRRPWLVVCSGMLLIVDYYLSVTSSGARSTCQLQSLPPGYVHWTCNFGGGGEAGECCPLYLGWCEEPTSLLHEPRTMGREKQLPVLCSLQTTLGLAWAGWWCRCRLGWFHWPWPWVQEGLVHPASAILGVPEHVLLRCAVIRAYPMLLKFRLRVLWLAKPCIWIDDADMVM